MKILVVDDDADVRSVVRRALAAEGHIVDDAGSIAAARDALTAAEPHIMLLDLGLPDGSGLAFCGALRSEGFTFPILVLTARAEVALRVKGLDAGADDYLPKPFAVAELRARVRALGRRLRGTVTAPLFGHPKTVGDVLLDFTKRRATRAATEVPITPRQWAILDVLVSRNGRLVSRTDLLEQVWGDASESSTNSLNVLIARLRAKLGPNVIRTIRNEGYAFGAEP